MMASAMLALASWIGARDAFANDSWLHFRDEAPYETERRGDIMDALVPSFSFPRFEIEGSGLAGGARGTLGASLSSPTLYYDSPISSEAELASPSPSPALPELQRFINELPYPAEAWLGLEGGRSVSARLDAELGYRRDRIFGEGLSLGWNQWEWFKNMLGDIEFPRKSWVAYAAPGYGIAAGRFPAGIGMGKFGSTLLNPQAPWYDQARLHIGDDRLRLVWMLGTSSTHLSASESDIQFRIDESDYSSYWDRVNDDDHSEGRSDAVKLFAYHLLEWRPMDRLRLGLAEMGMIGGTDPDLSVLLPTVCWHNAYAAGSANVAMAGLVSAVPLRGLLVSGEFLVDDMLAWDDSAASKPDSFAWQIQASYDFDPKPGLGLSLGTEFTHVDRWTYVRWQPYLTMYQRQMLPGGHSGIDVPLGYDYGPDVDHFGAWVGLKGARGARAELSYELVFKGPIRLGMYRRIDNLKTTTSTALEYIPVYYDYDDYAGEGKLAEILAKPDEIRNIVSLSGALPVGGGFEAITSVSLGFYENYGNAKGVSEQLVLIYAGVTYTYGAAIPTK